MKQLLASTALALLLTAGIAAGPATAAQPPRMITTLPGEALPISDFYNQNVYDSRDNKIGEINDLLLDTGGGLKKAAHFFLEDSSGRDTPFILHNVDVISIIDLHRMAKWHTEKKALATLAVQDRETSRYLLFDETLQLCGRRSGREGKAEIARQAESAQALAFSGIHIISPRFLTMMSEEGAFSIITTYLRLASQGERILGFRSDEYDWRDLGKPEQVLAAAEDLKK
jgi:NDP-sugar pyrophosphorylase family protein